ncbi:MULTISPECIES: restriction endonuclease subunit S [unclassified Empedobacter]|uniref:restriction endonuclease subunit S n=1 Tax=unclassified Empedobacter TaxID=2643773 RepID=UPI0025C149D2|nr:MULTISPECIES: restriction endonuclease subunit S [unclassified Empedobacter]
MIQNKVKSKLIFTEKRFNAGYFLNEDALNSFKLEINPQNCIALSELANVFNPPIFKRQFCQPSERAINYCQSSDVTNALEGSDVYINKKQAEKVGSVVKKNQILVTGFGTIGNTRLVNELSEGICYANNVCRIESNGKFPYGYLYAFMTSKFGRSQLNKNASGSVVRYIEAPGIKRTLVPILPEEKQQQIHQLIVDSANLRVEANKLLKEAVELIERNLDVKITKPINKFNSKKVNIKSLFDSDQKRLDSPVYITDTSNYLKSNNKFLSINELGFNVYRPGIFKRIKVDKANGIPYIKGSDLNKNNPFNNCEFLSKTKTPFMNEMILKEDQILFTCAGSIGDVKLITKEFVDNPAIGSQDIIRIENKNNSIPIEFLFAYLKTKFSFDYIQSIKYGSVIERVEPFHVESIPIQNLSDDIIIKVKDIIENYKHAFYTSFKKENQAINLIEKEIDAWQ